MTIANKNPVAYLCNLKFKKKGYAHALAVWQGVPQWLNRLQGDAPMAELFSKVMPHGLAI